MVSISIKNKKDLIWRLGVAICITYVAIEAPLSYAYKLNISSVQIVIDVFISIVFGFDFVRFLLKNDKKIYKWPKSKRYGLYIIEALAAIPYELLATIFPVLSIFKILRLLRLFRIIRLIKEFSILSGLTVLPTTIRFSSVLVSIIVAIHWIACGWQILTPFHEIDNFTNYNKSLYWAITTLTTIGYGDITPTTNLSRLYTMVIMILGVGVYGLVIGNVAKLIDNADKHKEKTREKINDLTLFMKHYNIPIGLQKEVLSYYNHIFQKRLSDNDTQIISELPTALQSEIQTYMNIKLIAEIPLFKNCGAVCLKDIANVLEQFSFSPGQTIISCGEIGEEMYVLSHGTVDIFTPEKDGSKKHLVATLNDGQFFGEMALMEKTVRNADVKARSYCDTYRLNKSDFLEIIEKYPILKLNIKNITSNKYSEPKAS
ncbi:MAG: cyclic nucleotide-binding domain-containing protein [Halobacteriovoraceae bacterium]|nr:cyclic nucleotide-binding domain-containing protein [Halobacteriovoraceae bacterium]